MDVTTGKSEYEDPFTAIPEIVYPIKNLDPIYTEK